MSATANSSASMIMIGTCTKKKMQVLVSARRKTGSVRQPHDVGEAAEAEVHALADLEAHPQRPQDRIDHEQPEQDQRRRNEQPAIDLGVAVEPDVATGRFPSSRLRLRRRAAPLATRRPRPSQAPAAAPQGKPCGRGLREAGTGSLPFPRAGYWICCLGLIVDRLEGVIDRTALGDRRQLRLHGGVDLGGEGAVVDARNLAEPVGEVLPDLLAAEERIA